MRLLFVCHSRAAVLMNAGVPLAIMAGETPAPLLCDRADAALVKSQPAALSSNYCLPAPLLMLSDAGSGKAGMRRRRLISSSSA